MRPTDFIAAIRKGKAGAAYFLRGPDRFLQDECRAAIANSVPSEARECCLAEIEFKPGHLAQELQGADQKPMLGGHSYLLLSDPEDFKHATDEDTEALRAYFERPSPFATVVFAAVEPDRRRRFTQLLEKKAEVVEMRPLSRQEAAAWATDFLRQAGVHVNPDLAEEIAAKFENSKEREPERAGVNLLWMRTELEKLLTAKPGAKRLERPDIDLIVAFRKEHQIGKLLRAVAERKCGEALEHLHALLASKTAETLLLWCIGDLVRQALKVYTAAPTASGGGPAPYGRGRAPWHAGAGGWNRPGSPFSTLEIAASAVRTYSPDELLQALRLVRRADLGIKSSWKDSRILLEFLVWQIIVGKSPESAPTWSEEVPAGSSDR